MTDPEGTASLDGVPAAPPPSGVSANLVNPSSERLVLLLVGSIFVTIMLLFVFVRIYTKIKIVKKSSPDDFTCVIAAIGTVGFFIISIFSVTIGHLGTHMWDLDQKDVSSEGFILTAILIDTISVIVWLFVKLSFFLLYIQLFHPMKWLRYCAYAGAGFNTLFYTVGLTLSLIYTAPYSGQTLQQSIRNPRQVHELAKSLPAACINLVLDVYILVLPIAGVSKLQLPTSKKLGVIAVFLTGLLACVSSSLSIYYNVVLRNRRSDLTYSVMFVVLANLIEMCCGVIDSCMPSMSNLMRNLRSWDTSKWKLTSFLPAKLLPSTRGSSSRSMGSKSRKAEYAHLEVAQTVFGERDHEMVPVKSIRTYIQTGGAHGMEEDGIHLQYEVDQESVER